MGKTIRERAESDHFEIAVRKRRARKEQRRIGIGNRNKTAYFSFWNCCFMFIENVIRNRKVRRAK
jgi:hypothetical protein